MTAKNKEKRNTATEAPLSSVGEAETTDPSGYEQLLQPWELINTPTERGNFGYRIWYLTLPGITLYREQVDRECHVQGLSPKNVFTMSIPIKLGSDSSYWHTPATNSSLPIMLPGGLDAQLGAGHDQLLILVELHLLADYLPSENYQALQNLAANHLLSSNSANVERFSNWLLVLLNGIFHKPDMLKHPAVVRTIQEDLLNRLADVIRVHSSSPYKSNLSRRGLGMDRALGFLREVDYSSVSIPEINKAAGVSLRTLEYAFRDTFELTPLAYLRLQRMHAARRDLLALSPGITTVMTVACKHGFYHPTKFAINYRRLFNEPPSKTLKQPAILTGESNHLFDSPLLHYV